MQKKNLSSRLLDSLSQQGEYDSASILSKSFIIHQDSAEVRLKLGLRLKSEIIIEGEKAGEIEKQIKLFLYKKRGKWKITRFSLEE